MADDPRALLDAPVEEVKAFQCKQCGLEVALADEERDLHRRLVEAQEKLKIDELAYAAMHEDRDKERKRAESAEQRAMESEKDAERLIDIANDFQCLSYGEWAEKYHCTKPTTLRAAIDAAKPTEGKEMADLADIPVSDELLEAYQDFDTNDHAVPPVMRMARELKKLRARIATLEKDNGDLILDNSRYVDDNTKLLNEAEALRDKIAALAKAAGGGNG